MLDAEDISLIQTILNFGLAMGVGFLVGIEREISNRGQPKRTGIRDFSLCAFLAFVSSLFYEQIPLAWVISFAGILLFSLTILVLEGLKKDRELPGVTTLLALPATFLVSSLPAFGFHFWTIATVIFALLILLQTKEQVHFFVKTLERREILDFAVLIGIAICLTPLIPEGAKLPIPLPHPEPDGWLIDYRYVKVSSLWKVVVMVSFMSFLAHFITKYIRGKNALILATFFGGLVSSLATILMLLRSEKQKSICINGQEGGNISKGEVFLGFVAANTGSILKDIVLLRLMIGKEMFATFLFPLASSLALFIGITLYAFSKQTSQREIRITNRPLPIGFIGKFSGVVSVLIVLMTMVSFYLGNSAIIPASFLSGIVSSAAAITSIGTTMLQDNTLNDWIAGLAIIAALMGSIIAKYLVVSKSLGTRESLPFIGPIVALGFVSIVTLWLSVQS